MATETAIRGRLEPTTSELILSMGNLQRELMRLQAHVEQVLREVPIEDEHLAKRDHLFTAHQALRSAVNSARTAGRELRSLEVQEEQRFGPRPRD